MRDIVGTWRLAKPAAHDDAGHPLHPPYGETPRGLLVFYADGRKKTNKNNTQQKKPQNNTIREYNSYCGNYEYDGKTLVTHVDASADPKRIGGDQTRFTHFEGELLVLTQKPRPWKGVMQHRALYWERIADAPAN